MATSTATYNTPQYGQPADVRGTHAGLESFDPEIAANAEPRAGLPSSAAWAGLIPWLAAGQRGRVTAEQHAGHTPALDNRGAWPHYLVCFGAQMHRATSDRATYQQGYARRGWYMAPFASSYHYLNRKRYTNVPVWAILGAPGNVSRGMRNQDSYRNSRPQPIVKSTSLAAALAQNAQAILKARSG